MLYFFSCSSPKTFWMQFPTVKRVLAVFLFFFSHRFETVRTGPAGVASRIPMFPTRSTDFVGRSYALSSRKLICSMKAQHSLLRPAESRAAVDARRKQKQKQRSASNHLWLVSTRWSHQLVRSHLIQLNKL